MSGFDNNIPIARPISSSSSLSLSSSIICKDSNNGKGLFINCDVKPGRIVIEEEPIIGWTERKYSMSTCIYCYHFNDDNNTNNNELCEACNRVCWCSLECKQKSLIYHTSNICYILAEGLMNLNPNDDLILQLCVGLISLEENGKNDLIDKFMNQNGDSVDIDEEEASGCQKVCQLLNDNGYPNITIEWVKTVFKKDKACGFAVMLPPTKRSDMVDNNSTEGDDDDDDDDNEDDDEDEEGMIRGYGVYPTLGLTNHSCIPNCIRWDNADVAGTILPNDRRKMCYRALIPIPRGSELFQSYVPLPWDYEDRQSYLKEMFGFTCNCKRCEVEKYEYDIEMENRPTTAPPSEIDEQYISMYLLRHLCPQKSCAGTLTPILDYENVVPDLSKFECNVCGFQRTNLEFRQLLEGFH